MTKEETANLESIFKDLDTNGDGVLSKEEILAGYERHFGIPIEENEVDQMFKEIDFDGNGSIDYTEFVMATMNQKNMITNDKLEQAFKMFDKVNIFFNYCYRMEMGQLVLMRSERCQALTQILILK